MSLRIRLTIAFIVSFIFVPEVYAEMNDVSQHIYSVRITPKGSDQKQIIQTGFKLSGIKGIITSLHSVLNSEKISAINDRGNVYTNLVMFRLDVEHDLVLLTCEALLKDDRAGIAITSLTNLKAKQLLTVEGHPNGINLIEKEVKSGDPCMKKIDEAIPQAVSGNFIERKSPAPALNVISIEATLDAGFAGSPVLNADKEVVGVILGNIKSIAYGTSYAIPVSDVKWAYRENELGNLTRLLKMNPGDLFSIKQTEKAIAENEKSYEVEYFKIQKLDTTKDEVHFSTYGNQIRIQDKISASSEEELNVKANAIVTDYLKAWGWNSVYWYLKDFWDQNNYGLTLTFPKGTTFESLKKWKSLTDVESGLEVGTVYDNRAFHIKSIDLASKHFSSKNIYTGKIDDVTLKLDFVHAVCSPLEKETFSAEELEKKKSQWWDFNVLSIAEVE